MDVILMGSQNSGNFLVKQTLYSADKLCYKGFGGII